jgi:hypothetical protein
VIVTVTAAAAAAASESRTHWPSESWLFRPACRHRSARAGSEKSLQIIFPME